MGQSNKRNDGLGQKRQLESGRDAGRKSGHLWGAVYCILKGLGDYVIVLNESSATVAEAAHALGVEPASIAKTLSDGLFCDSQSNADNIDSVLQT